MKTDGVHERINKAKLRAMLLPPDQGQHSQQEQSAVEAQRFEEQSHLHQKHRNVIEIAVPTQMISIDGIGINGISVESPLYEVLAGLRAGETFEFQQKTFVVTDVQ